MHLFVQAVSELICGHLSPLNLQSRAHLLGTTPPVQAIHGSYVMSMSCTITWSRLRVIPEAKRCSQVARIDLPKCVQRYALGFRRLFCVAREPL